MAILMDPWDDCIFTYMKGWFFMVGYHICFHVLYANIPNSCPEIVWVLSTTLLDEQRQHCPWHDMNHEILVGSASRILKDGTWKKSHYDWVLFHPPLKNNQPWGFVVHERFFFFHLLFRCLIGAHHLVFSIVRCEGETDRLDGQKRRSTKCLWDLFCVALGYLGLLIRVWDVLFSYHMNEQFWFKRRSPPWRYCWLLGRITPPPKKFNEWLPKMMGWKNAAPFTNGNIWYSC